MENSEGQRVHVAVNLGLHGNPERFLTDVSWYHLQHCLNYQYFR